MEEGNGEILLYTTTSSSTSIVASYFVQACKSITFYNHNLGVKNTTSPSTSSIVPSHFGKTGVCFEQKLQNSIWRTLLRTSNISSLFGEALLVFLY